MSPGSLALGRKQVSTCFVSLLLPGRVTTCRGHLHQCFALFTEASLKHSLSGSPCTPRSSLFLNQRRRFFFFWYYVTFGFFKVFIPQFIEKLVKGKVAQSCPTLCNPLTIHGILQARILEWVAIPFSKGSSQPRDLTQVSLIAGGFFTSWATREALNSNEFSD